MYMAISLLLLCPSRIVARSLVSYYYVEEREGGRETSEQNI